LLSGEDGNDTLRGNSANDILQGGNGNDILSDTAGNNLLNAGAGNDTLTGASGNELFIGGTGSDSITTGSGMDIIAFNAGDGQDTVVASTGADNTISLGGGIRYSDVALSKSGNDLILKTGATDSVTLQNWYASPLNHSVINLQFVVEASSDYNSASADTLLNQKVQSFNFNTLASDFDTALAANPTMTSWAVMSDLLSVHLAGSDTAAIGGDLTYQYNLNGTLAGIGLAPAQTELSSLNNTPQTLQSLASLQVGSVRLG
jgi:Ca2+-binding RTX toxin-like protein